MKIQEQKWHNFTRLLIVEDEGMCIDDIIGSIQVELYPEPKDGYGTTAYIYGLWVKESWRRKGIATALMDCVEEEIRARGHKVAALEWCERDTPYEIMKWYQHRGFKTKSFGKDRALLVKNLDERKEERQ